MKKIILFLCILLCAALTGCRTRPYSSEKAAKNGEIIYGGYDEYSFYNYQRLDKFIENVNKKIPDKIKIAHYGEEGMFLIETITYDGDKIKALFDSTMEFHKHERKKEKGEYSNVYREEKTLSGVDKARNIIVYYLTNDKERRDIYYMPGSK